MSASTLTFEVTGMTCQHCVDSVTRAVSAVSGISKVSVDLEYGIVTTEGNELSPTAITAAIGEAGYEATLS
jgi:copper ion binding protein